VTLGGRPFVVEVTTDNEGNFELNKLLPGSYTVLAKPKPMPPAKEPAYNRIEIVPTYFPSAIEWADAAPVIVRAGADASGIRIELRSVPVYRVRGVVLDDAGKPAAKTTVTLHSPEAEPGNSGPVVINLRGSLTRIAAPELGPAIATTVTDGQGAFEFSSVREGDWLLRAKRDVGEAGKQAVSLSQKDVPDIRIRLIANFNLPVTVDLEDSPGAAGPGLVNVVLVPVDGGPAVLDRQPYPGEYRVFVLIFRPDFYVASVDYAGRPVSDQPVEIESGPQPLHVVLRNHAGQVRGVVEKGQAATVLLLAASDAGTGIQRSVECAAGALFQFDNLHPGAYEIVAFDRMEDAKLSDPAFIARLHAMTKSIRVEEGANASLELAVNHWPE
jgi:hypothetical protein